MLSKDDMILIAEFMASCDVNATPMSGYDPGNLIPCEAGEVWSECLIVKHDGKEVGILPDKSKGMNIRTFVWRYKDELEEGDLDWECCYDIFEDYDWKPTDEELVKILREQDFSAPWVSPGTLKYIILKKWPEAVKNQ